MPSTVQSRTADGIARVGENRHYGNCRSAEEQVEETHHEQVIVNTYQIDFKPHFHLFKTGNEPLFMISELAELGELEVQVFTDAIPDIKELTTDEWRKL